MIDDAQLHRFAEMIVDAIHHTREEMILAIDPLERLKILHLDFERGAQAFGPSSDVARRRWERLQHAMMMTDPSSVEETWEAVGRDAAIKAWRNKP